MTMQWIKNNPIVVLLRHEWEYSVGRHGWVVLYFSFSFIANVIALLTPLLISRAINNVQFEANSPLLLRHVLLNLSLTVLVNLCFWIFHASSRITEKWNAYHVRKDFKETMIARVLALPAGWHQDHHSGDTINKINKAANSLYTFSESSFSFVEACVQLFGSIAVMAWFDWRASLIALAVAAVAVSVILFYDKRLVAGWKIEYQFENKLAAAIHDYISNIRTIITLRLEARVKKEVRVRSLAGLEQYQSNSKINEFKWFLVSMLIAMMAAGVLSLNAYISYATTGVIVVGTLFALYQYLYWIGNTFYQFAWKFSEYVQWSTALGQVDDINETYNQIAERSNLKLPDNWQTIEIKNLLFDYNKVRGLPLDAHHLQNVSLTINRGDRIALVGESGSGKSTTLALIRGLYPPKSVQVYVNSKKLKHGLRQLYESVTLIPQDPEIFNSTVEDNITMETEVNNKELNVAINLAQFRSVLERLPHGLQTNVMEKGVSLSGGEKQRLALARGILAAKNSPILLMDEPTSSVDAMNEQKINENIFSVFKEKTIIATIHRLHLLRYFDYIYFFDHGRIVAEGNLEQMLNYPDFKTLWDKSTASIQE
jgi:ABC-type multidrug transport system fused ATPase/permease subunit